MRVTTRAIGDIPGCKPAGHSPTMLELHGIGLESTADQYCKAIQDYKADKIDEVTMWGLLSLKHLK